MTRILKFFQTAPQTRSDKVLEFEKKGKIDLIVDAVRKERKGLAATERGISVKRVGAYSSSK